MKTGNVFRKDDDCDEEKTFENPTDEHSAVGKDADWSFSGESFGRARESGTKSGFEFFPGRRPLDEQMWWFRPDDGRFGNGLDFGH